MIGVEMDMPSGCDKCRFQDDFYCYACADGLPDVPDTGRPGWCPLIDLSQYEDDWK